MKLQRLDAGRGALHWFPDSTPLGTRAADAIAGPFDTRAAAYWWLIGKLEDGFTTAKKALWADAVAQLGSRPDPAHLMGLAMMVADGLARDVWRKGAARQDRGGGAEAVSAIVGRVA
jgi:hypothetical protein